MTKLIWKTEKRKVKDLLPADFNPRKISPEKQQALQNSFEKFNLAEIPIINKDNTLIGGNQRMATMVVLGRGDETIDVRVPNRLLTEEELKEYMLISNTHAGEFDNELLEIYFPDIEIEFDIPIFDQSYQTVTKTKTQSTVQKMYFLNVKCNDEAHAEELFDRLASEGLEVKIIT